MNHRNVRLIKKNLTSSPPLHKRSSFIKSNNPATVKEVLHLASTLFDSIKKKIVAATIAIEIIQKLMPTKSSALKFVDAEATRGIMVKTLTGMAHLPILLIKLISKTSNCGARGEV